MQDVKLDFPEICTSQRNFTTSVENFLLTTLVLANSSFDLCTYFGLTRKEAPLLVQIAILVTSKVNHV